MREKEAKQRKDGNNNGEESGEQRQEKKIEGGKGDKGGIGAGVGKEGRRRSRRRERREGRRREQLGRGGNRLNTIRMAVDKGEDLKRRLHEETVPITVTIIKTHGKQE